MANIFISFYNGVSDPNNPNAIPCFYETFCNCLEKLGNKLFVYTRRSFNLDFENIPKNLLSEIKEFNPDLIILFNNAFYDVSKHFDCPIVVYEVDSPLLYLNKEGLKKNISRYKFFVPQEESVKVLQEQFGVDKKDILLVPFFTEIRAEDTEFKTNISFIGTKFIYSTRKSPFAKFMTQNPDDEEVKLYKILLDEFCENVYLDKDELFKKYNVQSKNIDKRFQVSELLQYLSDYNRVKTLSSVADLGLDLYGTANWRSDTYNEPWLILSYKNKAVYSIKHNQDIYNSSKIGININHLQAKTGFSWRVCDIMASNACLVSEYKSDLKRCFPEIDIPFFTNSYEAREQCVKLLNNENLRKDIVLQSQAAINKSYRFSNVKRIMEEYLNMQLEGNGSGETKFLMNNDEAKKSIKFKIRLMMYLYNKLSRKLIEEGVI